MSVAVVDGLLTPIGVRHCAVLASAISVNRFTDITAYSSETGGSALTGVVAKFASDGATAGVGTLRYTNTGDLIAYKAPGDTSFGADVDCSSDGDETLTSANGQSIDVTITAASLPGADGTYYINVGVPTGARAVLISPITQAIMVRADGRNPTATIGVNVPATTSLLWTSDPRALRIIELTSSARVTLQYFTA